MMLAFYFMLFLGQYDHLEAVLDMYRYSLSGSHDTHQQCHRLHRNAYGAFTNCTMLTGPSCPDATFHCGKHAEKGKSSVPAHGRKMCCVRAGSPVPQVGGQGQPALRGRRGSQSAHLPDIPSCSHSLRKIPKLSTCDCVHVSAGSLSSNMLWALSVWQIESWPLAAMRASPTGLLGLRACVYGSRMAGVHQC